jgi:hypothetical protein
VSVVDGAPGGGREEGDLKRVEWSGGEWGSGGRKGEGERGMRVLDE